MTGEELEKARGLSGATLLLAVMYVGAALAWMLALIVLLAVLSAVGVFSAEAAEGVVFNSVLTVLMISGLVLLAAMLARWNGADLATAFAWHRRAAAVLLVSMLAGLVYTPASSWFVQFLTERFEALDLSHLELIAGFLCEGPVPERLLFAVVVLLIAPVGEELVFRGFLWSALEQGSSRWIAWILTSLLFALYHGDPLHILAVLPLGLILGWLRMVSGSIWPSIAVHFGNNAMAVLWTLYFGADADFDLSAWIGGASVLASLSFLGCLRLFPSLRRDARE